MIKRNYLLQSKTKSETFHMFFFLYGIEMHQCGESFPHNI